MLSLVSTPIGNLEDMTFRAIRTLKECDLIACEDTRTTGILCKHYGIETRRVSFHGHSTDRQMEVLLEQLEAGKHIALVSDAGTPWISDPGFVLIRAAVERGIEVSCIPGASALLAGLVASGFDTHEFVYLGFLPVKKGRETAMKALNTEEQTVVLYESVHRIEKTLSDLAKFCGNTRRVCVARELTKKFEEFFRGTLEESLVWVKQKSPKGEFVVILERSNWQKK